MDKIIAIPEELIPSFTNLMRWWCKNKHLVPEHRRRSKGGGSGGSKSVWMEVIRGLVRADVVNEIAGYDFYLLRLVGLDITEIELFSAQEYPVGSIVKAAGWTTWDDSELEIIYRAKLVTGGDGSPNSSEFWEPIDLIVNKPYQYEGHANDDLRNYIPWFPVGSVVPVIKRNINDTDTWFIDAALIYTGPIGNCSICWDEDSNKAITVYR